MRDEILNIAKDILSSDLNVANEAIKVSALLLEKMALKGKGYDQINGLYGDVLKYSLSEEEYKVIVDSLKSVVGASGCVRASACWALGKVYSSDMVKFLESVGRENIENDEVVYQVLISIENCGIYKACDFIKEVSLSGGLDKSSKYASELIDLYRIK